MAKRRFGLDDLYLETDELFVGSVCEVLSGSYNKIKLAEKVKYYPRFDETGFVLHKGRINSYEEIGQKIVDLKEQYDNVFCPGHYNDIGVKTWDDGEADVTYAFYNYVEKLYDEGLLLGEPNAVAAEYLLDYVDHDGTDGEFDDYLNELKIRGTSGSADSKLVLHDSDGLEDTTNFLVTYATSLLMTTDLHLFDTPENFSFVDTQRMIYVFDEQFTLAAVLCKVVKDFEGIGYIEYEAAYMVTKDQDILFVHFINYFEEACDSDFDELDYVGPGVRPDPAGGAAIVRGGPSCAGPAQPAIRSPVSKIP